ncbi:MAG: hypothetical protein IVW55_00620 [Chloroflexi bacterium]|nr:hypothetical protein [Chloroflexota bacterium]
MGREIRRVPPWWQHPVDVDGKYIPLFDRSYDEAVRDYEYGLKLWEEGRHPSQLRFPDDTAGLSFAQWCGWEGEPPDPRIYRRESWTEDEATAVQLYETISEGTPASPVFGTLDDLGVWMSEHGYSPQEVAKILSVGRLPSGVIYFPDEPGQVS